MFSFLRDFSNSLTKSADKAEDGDNNTDSNRHVDKTGSNIKTTKSIRVKKKNMAEELENLTTKYPYSRPPFLGLRSTDELQVVLKHSDRLITLPKRSSLPRSAGYAECTNAGKSLYNEDQACAIELRLGISQSSPDLLNISEDAQILQSLDKLTIYGVFDGHAGADVAVTVSQELPHRIKERISNVIQELKYAKRENIQEEDANPQTIHAHFQPGPVRKKPTVDRLITGAFEAAFQDMDANLIEDETLYTVKGGCASLVTLFYAGKLYVANAGDCRAVLSLSGEPVVMSTDFNPEYERRRLQAIGEQHPDLLGDEFCPRQFTQRVTRKDLGNQMLYRDSRMEGWAHKKVEAEDLRFPMIMGEGRRARLLATIGLTRGLGDHNLKVFDSAIRIKPFLSCIPAVEVKDLSGVTLTPNDVVIMGSDGLWDVITNAQAIQVVQRALRELPFTDSSRYIAAAQALIGYSRGQLRTDRRDIWVLSRECDEYASHDDITCFVVPIMECPIEQPTKTLEEHELSTADCKGVNAESDNGVVQEILDIAHAEENKSQNAAFSGSTSSVTGSCSSLDTENSCEKSEDDNQRDVLSEDEPCVNSNESDYTKDSHSPEKKNPMTDEAKTLS